ncbi:hypothetical protein CHKEEEPN_3442 [Methylorubrum podarium]|nr:hypothetical protein CHKEEEPN_3442 [Methylorubrum podarium]
MTVPAVIPSTENGTTSGVSVSGPKVATIDCSGRTQRREPACAEAAPQRIDFGQGKLLMMPGRISASTSSVSRPGRSITAR